MVHFCLIGLCSAGVQWMPPSFVAICSQGKAVPYYSLLLINSFSQVTPSVCIAFHQSQTQNSQILSMGNVLGKTTKAVERAERNTVVDGGRVVCMDDRRLAHAHASSSTNGTPAPPNAGAPNQSGRDQKRRDYDGKMVIELIKSRKLAPFYEGIDEQAPSTSDTGIQDAGSSAGSVEQTEPENALVKHDPGGGSQSATTTAAIVDATETGKKKQKRMQRFLFFFRIAKKKPAKKDAPSESSAIDEEAALTKWLHASLLECPICFLLYPRNINWTRCCHQQICTFCFLHLRFPPSGREITCPFCNAKGFTVRYVSPSKLASSSPSSLGTSVGEADHAPSDDGMLKALQEGTVGSSIGSSVKISDVRLRPPPAQPRGNAGRTYHHRRQHSQYQRSSSGNGYRGSGSGAGGDYYHRRQYSYYGNGAGNAGLNRRGDYTMGPFNPLNPLFPFLPFP